MKHLIISSLPELNPPGVNAHYLGEWCLSTDSLWDRQNTAPVLPYPWDDPSAKAVAFEESNRLYETLLHHLASSLTRLHGRDLPVRYWRILLGPWLMAEVHVLYDIYECLRAAREKWGPLKGIGLSREDFFDLPDFSSPSIARVFGAHFHAQMTTQLMERMEFPIERKTAKLEDPKNRQSWVRASYGKLSAPFCRLHFRLSNLKVVGSGLPPSERLLRSIKSGFSAQHISRFPYTSSTSASKDFGRREKLFGSHPFQSSREKILCSILAENLPLNYLESYSEFRSANLLPTRRSIWLGGTAWFGDETFKLNAAEAMLKGDPLLGMQHGGYYGFSLHHPPEQHERKCCDRYLTWGWQESSSDIPIPSPLLSQRKINSRAKRVKEGLLFVATSHPRQLFRFQSHPLGPQWLNYHRQQIAFFKALSPKVREQLRIRLYPMDFGWNFKEKLHQEVPNLRMDDIKRSADSLNASRLIVIDHPATTFLEAMSAGIPTVGFWDPKYFEMRPSALDSFKTLQEVGIVVS